MSVTTKTGDKGLTSLLNGSKVHKHDVRIELIGNIDELQSYLGVIKSLNHEEEINRIINNVQKNLSNIMAQISYGSNDKYKLPEGTIEEIEKLINEYESVLIKDNKFIIPGDNVISAHLDVGRTIARKVERSMNLVNRVHLIDSENLVYINRLSDFLFVIARYIEVKDKITKRVKKIIGDEKVLNLQLSKIILEKVEEKAQKEGINVVIAIANEWGNTIAVHFMDNALPGSFDIALNKAYTSAVLRLSTDEVGELSQNGMPLYGIGNTNNNKIVTFAGGFPIKCGDKVIGAVGVSGGTAVQDYELGFYAVEISKNILEEVS